MPYNLNGKSKIKQVANFSIAIPARFSFKVVEYFLWEDKVMINVACSVIQWQTGHSQANAIIVNRLGSIKAKTIAYNIKTTHEGPVYSPFLGNKI